MFLKVLQNKQCLVLNIFVQQAFYGRMAENTNEDVLPFSMANASSIRIEIFLR